MLLALTLALPLPGCRNTRPQPISANQQPLNASALSGGKITHFIGNPELPNDPRSRAMLEVCQHLTLNSTTARSGYAIFNAPEGQFPVGILIVGNQTLACLGDVFRNHNMPLQIINGIVVLYPGSSSSITLDPSKKFALVGKTKIALKNKALYQPSDKQLIMSLPDMITVFHARDEQTGGHEIQFLKTVDNLNGSITRTPHGFKY